MDSVWGEEFCGVMLPELRRMIVEYIPSVPAFDPEKCSPSMRLEDGQMINVSSWSERVWRAALAHEHVRELFRSGYAWRVHVSGVVEGSTFVGVADQLHHACPYTGSSLPASHFFGITDNGLRFQRGGPNSCPEAQRLWKDSRGDTNITVDIRCDLLAGSVQVRRPDQPWETIYTNIADLGNFYPYVELGTRRLTATFQPIPPE